MPLNPKHNKTAQAKADAQANQSTAQSAADAATPDAIAKANNQVKAD